MPFLPHPTNLHSLSKKKKGGGVMEGMGGNLTTGSFINRLYYFNPERLFGSFYRMEAPPPLQRQNEVQLINA